MKENNYNKENCSIICLLGGDQTCCWVQKLQVIKCDIPFEDAKKLFELHNRFHNEYENNEYSYLGLDNLVDEVEIARKKMKETMISGLSYKCDSDIEVFIEYALDKCKKEPERYSNVEKYLIEPDYSHDVDMYSIRNIFESHVIEKKEYYWIDQCRVTEEEWNGMDGFNHWYEIMELYNPEKELPFDFTDEDIVSIFGFNKFEGFADLSYGC